MYVGCKVFYPMMTYDVMDESCWIFIYISSNTLKARDDIVITNADKGGAIVMLDVKDYVENCERQLNYSKN